MRERLEGGLGIRRAHWQPLAKSLVAGLPRPTDRRAEHSSKEGGSLVHPGVPVFADLQFSAYGRGGLRSLPPSGLQPKESKPMTGIRPANSKREDATRGFYAGTRRSGRCHEREVRYG